MRSPATGDGAIAGEDPELNRVIWMLWLQGFEQAPELVRHCLRSWKTRNPGWTVVELDAESLPAYIDPDTLETILGLRLKHQKTANLIRLYLLSRHGGVWADASCFCVLPLDSWLPEHLPSGFFAFRLPGDSWLREGRCYPLLSRSGYARGDRVMANWFLAARRGNPLVSTFYEKHKDFFLRNRFPLQHADAGRRRISRIHRLLGRNSRLAQLWTSPLIIRLAKVYPYFIFHYHFAAVVRTDAGCRQIWEQTPVRLPGLWPVWKVLHPMTQEEMDRWRQRPTPVYKFSWKRLSFPLPENSLADLLIRDLDA